MPPDVLPLVPACSEYITDKAIDEKEGCTVQQFCTQNELNPNAFSIFLSMEYPPEGMKDQSPRDVILINKVHYHTDSTAVVHVTQLSMFTCTIALLIIGVKRVIHWSLCSSNT